MKNTTVSLLTLSFLATASQLFGASFIYEQTFGADPTVAMNNNNSNVMGSTGTQVGQYVRSTTGGSQFNWNASSHLDVSGRAAFNYGMALILDVSTWAAGDYSLTFDVSNYSSGNAANFTTYSLWEGSGVNFSNAAGGSVKVDLTQVAATTGTPTFAGAQDGAALTTEFANGTTFTSSVDFDFSLTEGGTSGDWLMIGWGTSRASGANATSYDLDNVRIAAIPEPSSAALLGLGGLALILRRCR